MGKGSAKQEVTEYRMSVHIGACYGPVDAVTSIVVNEKVAWEGTVHENGTIEINQPKLFGGQKKEGGLVGYVHVLFGRANQVLPADLASKLGRTPETAPGFRELLTFWFTSSGKGSNQNAGNGIFSRLLNSLVGVAPVGQGFLWTMNNPMIAQNLWFGVRRAPIPRDENYDPIPDLLDPDLATIVLDGKRHANPAHIIFECYLNHEWGRGENPVYMDIPAYNAAAQTLFDEKFGLSYKWVDEDDVDEFINEVLRTIQAEAYLDPTTGLHTIKLLRGDYDPLTIPEINANNATLSDYKERFAGESINEITVKYTNHLNEKEVTVTVQEGAGAQVQGIKADVRPYPGIRNDDLAWEVAARDVRYASAPLVSCEAVVDRTLWDLKPGDVVRLNWPENKAINLIMRVGKVNYGRPGDTKITVPLVQDIYSLAKRPVVTIPPTEWVDPSEDPAPMANTQILTIPAFFASTAILQQNPVTLTYPEVMSLVFGYQPGLDTAAYELLSAGTLSDGTEGLISGGDKPIIERSLLTEALVAETDSTIPGAIVQNADRGPRVGGYVFIGYGDENSEIAFIHQFEDNDIKVKRGVLDTKPRPWPIGTPVWWLNSGARVTDDTTIRAAGETVDYQLLPRTSRGSLDVDDAPVVSATLTDRPHLPLRPANVAVNGTYFGAHDLAGAADVVFTWATRNRLLEDGQVVAWDEDAVPPEYRQATVITAYDEDDTPIIAYTFWNDTTYTVPASEFARFSAVRFEFSSTRDSLDSINNHSVTVTGFANNPEAALPSIIPELGEPPSPVSAPAADAFYIAANAIPNDDGGSIPAIVVAGLQDDQDAEGLVIRYRKTGTTDWQYHETVMLSRRAIRAVIAGVAAQTEYQVQIAYIQANILGEFLDIGPVTTGSLVAGDTTNVGGRPTYLVIDQLDSANLGVNYNSTALLQRSLDNWAEHQLLLGLGYLNGVPVGTVLKHEVQNRVEGDLAIVQVLDLIGAKSGDGLAFILNMDTVKVDDDETLAQRFTAIEIHNDSVDASLVEFAEIISDVDDRLSAAWGIVQNVDGHIAAIKLLSVADGGEVESELTFLADTIKFFNGTTNQPVVEIVGGRLVLYGDLVATNSLLEGAAVRITSDQDTGFSVEVPSQGGSPGYAEVKSMDFQVDYPESKLTVTISMPYESGNSNITHLYIKIGTEEPVWSGSSAKRMDNADLHVLVSGYNGPVTLTFTVFDLTPGINTLEVWCNSEGSGSHTNDLLDPYFQVREDKKPL